MTMRLVMSIPVPWTPYSATFSRDGTRLAIGGGVFYGNGGILIVDLVDERTELFRCDSLPHAQGDWVPAISGLCFSDDDRYVAASSWKGRHHYAPTVLFDVSKSTLTLRSTLKAAIRGVLTCPRGVLFSGRYIVTRNHRAEPDEVLVVGEVPGELGIEADNTRQHLTNSHLAVVRNQVITAGRGLLLDWNVTDEERLRALVDFRDSGRAVDEGLVSVALDGGDCTPQLIPVQSCRQVTAIAATPDGQGFVTGGLEGELDQWSWSGRWRQERLREWSWDSPSVRGICHMHNGRTWVSVSSSGRLDLLVGNAPGNSWQLPSPGSPRTLAAHPVEDWIAIGMKQSGWGDPRGVVDLIEIKTPV
jgi:hypothetical protein